jgi:CO dehydrogenase/acetyl-CoA synthase alpha subunit
MTLSTQKKFYLTDLEQNLTFAGVLKFYEEESDFITATLSDIEVYDYESSTPLFSLGETTFKKSKHKIHVEGAPVCLNSPSFQYIPESDLSKRLYNIV